MVRPVLLFVLKLIAVSLVLFVLWQGAVPGLGSFWPGGLERPWLAWQKAVLRWFYQVLELDASTYNQAWRLARGYVLSVIPFVGLMMAAGPARVRQLLSRGLLGLAIIGCWQVLTPLVLYLLRSQYGGGKSFFVGIFPVFMFSYALPFILWILFSRDRIGRWFSQAKTSDRQSSGK